ncbi:MAG: hypothetical protein KF901_05325 [Myxococcales bacterium]|nr:hypothetical protein [Myxococcales bacterium]
MTHRAPPTRTPLPVSAALDADLARGRARTGLGPSFVGAAQLVVAALVGVAISACGGAPPRATTPEPTADDDRPGPEVAVALRLVETDPEPELDMPRSRAELVLIHVEGAREVTEVGTLDGICQPTHEPGTVGGASCWWAGAGVILRVRRDGDTLRVIRIQDDSESGQGPEEELLSVDLPRRAQLRPLLGH